MQRELKIQSYQNLFLRIQMNWLLVLLSIMASFVFGFVVAYSTVEVVNATPGDLGPSSKRLWVEMTADFLALSKDVTEAQRRLSFAFVNDPFFTEEEVANYLTDAITNAEMNGDLAQVARLRQLDLALNLGVTSSAPHSSLIPQPMATPFLVVQEPPGRYSWPTLADFWEGRAEFALEVEDTGLPMGESETIVMSNGEFWSYLHASNQSAGAIDQCGAPVEYPGCTVIYRSYDGGYTFSHDEPLVCQFECKQCPCDSNNDHINQQQYPRVFYDDERLTLFYEHGARTFIRRSFDGLNWNQPEAIGPTGVWRLSHRECLAEEVIGPHPFTSVDYDCLAGAPPGIYIEGERVYAFVALGQNPSRMGCYVADINAPGHEYQPCKHNPLFQGASEYGPLGEKGPQTNPYFDFRTISSADVQKIGPRQEARYYMLYEGLRGPAADDPGDSQFGLGLARTQTNEIDGPWEEFPDNPILVDLPGNIGLGHADLVVYKGQTLLYTSLDGVLRSRLALVWK